ncbi:hypothetical protein BKM20_07135 [Pseudomonas avellanae]|uniref:RND efflux transporter n=2 Tax=Pseudomonas syringae group TaxID=136849 RepID=A0A3M2WGE0_PSEA0|nr:RND efflux transporter [Pseudomonas amygdali pv. morsprunorum str. M302280]KWS72781.1 hypothetical protein AL055_12060 [Pseudomonas amygdali pv. morsprunorum]PHN38833.1 hypothetical protein AO261_13780 [Pseudomonas avellanae]SPF11815.1 RND efflux transporter [Pseudomonas syringae group genomosp. 3]POC96172.1 hypothetical protein BKM26_06625 [Pseudomonas avellanae]
MPDCVARRLWSGGHGAAGRAPGHGGATAAVSHFRDDDELIDILLRGTRNEREQLGALSSLAIPTQNGTSVALSQVATLDYGFEEGVIWHRNRLPSVTVRADIYGKEQPATLVKQILPTLDSVRAELPDGYLLEVGGTVEELARGQNSVNAGMPLFIVVVLTLLMIQLRSFSRMLMVLITAPLGLIGVTLTLLFLPALYAAWFSVKRVDE